MYVNRPNHLMPAEIQWLASATLVIFFGWNFKFLQNLKVMVVLPKNKNTRRCTESIKQKKINKKKHKTRKISLIVFTIIINLISKCFLVLVKFWNAILVRILLHYGKGSHTHKINIVLSTWRYLGRFCSVR